MNDTKGFLLAAVVGVAAFGLVWALAPAPSPEPGPVPSGPDDPAEVPTMPPGMHTPFGVLGDLPATILLIDSRGHLEANQTWRIGDGLRATTGNGTGDVRLARVGLSLDPCEGCPVRTNISVNQLVRPRLLQDGFLVANVTIYVFDDVGSLLATNDDEVEPALGTPSVRLQKGTWYFGMGAAPANTTHAHQASNGLLGEHLGALRGLPVEGVHSARISQHPYAGLVGPIYVSMQVDALHRA